MIGAYYSIMKADAGPELLHLRAFRAVAEEGSFAGAAAVLGCSQPAVSQQIAQLETHLGVRVLHRRPLRPTDAGRVLLAAGNEVVTGTVINLVAAGLGIALLPSLVLSDRPRGVARCGLRHVPLLRRIYVERPNSKQVTRAVAGLEVSLRRVLLDRDKHSKSI